MTLFHQQEKERFENHEQPYTFDILGVKSLVAPLKGFVCVWMEEKGRKEERRRRRRMRKEKKRRRRREKKENEKEKEREEAEDKNSNGVGWTFYKS